MTQETLEKQTSDTASVTQRFWVIVVCLLVTIALIVLSVQHFRVSDPYVQEVLSLTGHSDRGQAIFQMNCATCHGIEATGEVGPSLRGVSARRSKVSLINQVITGKTPPMPQFQPEPQVMADLLDYLETL
ncbi:MAG: cytochrome c [Leptolyngbyaceae cyanobacterium MO_188.B28]|nr:cytochrome c [Leptolyngbyaceae cyanobacterium MO_188.B28]